MNVAHEHGLVFNGQKCEVKKDSFTFFGIVYDADGAHPDPKKVDWHPSDTTTRDPNTATTISRKSHISHYSSLHSLHPLHHLGK